MTTKRGHHFPVSAAPYRHPWRRDREIRHGWVPQAVGVRIVLPVVAPAATPDTSATPVSETPVPQTPPPPPFDPRSITLDNVLRTFQNLPDPHSRVFGGFFRPADAGGEPGGQTVPFPMVSGIASPGSKVQVVFSDDAGIRQQDTTVHSDVQGYWMASMNSKTRLLPPKWVQVSITPPTWAGDTAPVEFLVAFPGEELTASGHIRGIAAGGLIGTVLPAARVESEAEENPVPNW